MHGMSSFPCRFSLQLIVSTLAVKAALSSEPVSWITAVINDVAGDEGDGEQNQGPVSTGTKM